MPVSILKSRLVVVKFEGSWKPFNNLMKAVGLFSQRPLEPVLRPSDPYSQFIS